MLDRPYLMMLATLLLMMAPFIAAPQIATLTGVPLVGVLASLVLMTLPLLQAMVRFDSPTFATALQISLCLLGVAMMSHWRPGQSVAEVLGFAKWTALPFATAVLLAWLVTKREKFRHGAGFEAKSFAMIMGLVLLLAFLTFEPISQRGYGVSLVFAVLAAATHSILLLQATSDRRAALTSAQIWAVRGVEALGFADLLLLIAVLRPETPLLLSAILAPVATLMYAMHAPISRAFRR